MSLPQLSTSRKFCDIVIITILSGFLLFSCTFYETNMSFASAAPIVLFEDVLFKGIKSRLHISHSSTCVNLVGKLNDFYSSVDTMGVCFLLCEHLNCNGKCVQVQGKLKDLNSIGLNDVVSSVTLCEQKNQHNISENLVKRRRRKRNDDVKLITTNFPRQVERRKIESIRPTADINQEQENFSNQQKFKSSVEETTLRHPHLKLTSREPSLVSSSQREIEIISPVKGNNLGLKHLLKTLLISAPRSRVIRVDGGGGHILNSNSHSKDNQILSSTSKGNLVENSDPQRISSEAPSTSISSSKRHRRKGRRHAVNQSREQHQ